MTAAGLQILVTELGDETFIIAAIMAMRHPRLVVYVGAMSALVSMTVSWNAFCLLEIVSAACSLLSLQGVQVSCGSRSHLLYSSITKHGFASQA